jgi:hypothetical protein
MQAVAAGHIVQPVATVLVCDPELQVGEGGIGDVQVGLVGGADGERCVGERRRQLAMVRQVQDEQVRAAGRAGHRGTLGEGQADGADGSAARHGGAALGAKTPTVSKGCGTGWAVHRGHLRAPTGRRAATVVIRVRPGGVAGADSYWNLRSQYSMACAERMSPKWLRTPATVRQQIAPPVRALEAAFVDPQVQDALGPRQEIYEEQAIALGPCCDVRAVAVQSRSAGANVQSSAREG